MAGPRLCFPKIGFLSTPPPFLPPQPPLPLPLLSNALLPGSFWMYVRHRNLSNGNGVGFSGGRLQKITAKYVKRVRGEEGVEEKKGVVEGVLIAYSRLACVFIALTS